MQREACRAVEESVLKSQDRVVGHFWAEYEQSKNMPSHPKSVTAPRVFRKL